MAESSKKGAFLGKLARFVSNPTKDWSSLDSAPPSQFLDAPEMPEGTQFTQAEMMAMRHQRRKKNRSIRIKEFGMLRNVRAGKVIPGVAPSFNSVISEILTTQPGSQDTKTSPASTRMGDGKSEFDVNKIDNIEQQMAEQWWDDGGAAPAPMPLKTPEVSPEVVPKTQMLIQDDIDKQPTQKESDTIEIDPSFFKEPTAEKAPTEQQSERLAPPVPPEKPEHATVTTADPDSIPVDSTFFDKATTPQVPEKIQSNVPEVAQETITVEQAKDAVLPVEPTHASGQQVAIQGAGEDVDTSEADKSAQFLHTVPVEEVPIQEEPVENKVHLDMADYVDASDHVHVDALPESLNEPAILFAQDKDADVEMRLIEQSEALKDAVEKDPTVEQQEPHALLTLLDYYRATKQEERFENACLYMVQLLGRSAPQYLAVDLAQASRILSTVSSTFIPDGSQSNWSSSAELDLTDVMLLCSQLMEDPGQVLLDWRKLEVILDEAVEPLVDQLKDLSQRKIELLMWGGEHLLACCKQQLDADQPKAIYTWLWHLRLELVRLMHGEAVFEEESIEYCVALEESPPPWIVPKCNYIDADEASDILDEPPIDDADDSQVLESNVKHPLQWQGSVRGSIQQLLAALDAACDGQECVIDCVQLDRIDSIATTELLAWLMAQSQASKRIQFINVNRLVATFWRIMGIHMQADIELRRD